MSDPNLTRLARRHAEHERQSVIFGIIFAILAVTLLVGAAVFTDTVRVGFLNRPFSSPEPEAPPLVPCPPEGALPVELVAVTVSVYNTTTYGGLAQTTANALQALGFTIGETGNDDRLPQTVIIFGPEGIAQAYTLLPYVPDAQLLYTATHPGTELKLMLGANATNVADDVVVDANTPIIPAPGCVPVESIKS
ncbi:MAG: LytR C-terminal domain-containing protein [Micrococcales bacterium]|nr:LytR C-terminal domain-containing protein [Micrococcales bacterium]